MYSLFIYVILYIKKKTNCIIVRMIRSETILNFINVGACLKLVPNINNTANIIQ